MGELVLILSFISLEQLQFANRWLLGGSTASQRHSLTAGRVCRELHSFYGFIYIIY